MGHRFPLRTGCGVKWDVDILPFLTTYYGTIKKINQNSFRANFDSMSDKATSPIFFQFLEAVHQLVRCGPTMFQFTDDLLIFIADSLYDGRFTTFFENSVKIDDNCASSTLLEYVMDHLCDFANLTYKGTPAPFFPVFDMSDFTIWNEYYFRNSTNIIRVPQASK